ncbi:DddA-like double-stranded DNA deaminase toxin [Saccharothrix sp. HUAS TT1]|uniref:DddA-like double-stranded DNA deaminase toxin n=1 Tax=unclassified Saccharothrix TaxID=2593673 RepID=UPI00345B92DE
MEAIRRTLPPPVVIGSGQKTAGRWINSADGTTEPVMSGFDPRSALVQSRLARMGLPTGTRRSGDVEMKVAAHMAASGITHAEVVINNTPCRNFPDSCDTLIPILLPEGSTLTIHGQSPNGTRFQKRYTGGAEPWWR